MSNPTADPWRPGDFTGGKPPHYSRAKLTTQQRQDICRRWAEAQTSDKPPVRWDFCKEMAQEFRVSAFTINRTLGF